MIAREGHEENVSHELIIKGLLSEFAILRGQKGEMYFHFLLRGTNEASVENGGAEVVGVDASIVVCMALLEFLPDGYAVSLLLVLERPDELLVLLAAVLPNITNGHVVATELVIIVPDVRAIDTNQPVVVLVSGTWSNWLGKLHFITTNQPE
jgi:hypothetical protein